MACNWDDPNSADMYIMPQAAPGAGSRSAALADSSEDEEDGDLIFNHLDVRTDIVFCRTSTRIEAGPFVSSHSHSLTTHHHACMRAIGLTALSDLAPASHVVLI